MMQAMRNCLRAKTFPLRRVGCAGRISGFTEREDGRLVMTLAGIARFVIGADLPGDEPFRIARADFAPYAKRFRGGPG